MHRIPRPGRAALLATVALAAILTAACGGTPGSAGPAAGLGRSLPSRLPGSSARHIYFVDGAHGSDRNRGSRRAPWKTIDRALRTVPLSGSVIKVRPGTYTSTGSHYAITFNRKGNVRDPVTLEAAVPGTVTIENGDPAKSTTGAWIVHASGLRIRGLRFRLLTRRASNVGANAVLIEDSDRIEIVGCTFNEVSLIGLTVRGGLNSTSDDVWVINNIFRPSGNNATEQVTGLGYASDQYFGSKGSHWIYAGQYARQGNWEQTSGTRRFVVVNNVFTGSAAGRDIQLGPQARNSYIVNNTFYGNRSADSIGRETAAVHAGQAVELFSNSSTAAYVNGFNTIANNLFVNLQGAAVSGSGPAEPGNVVMDNLSWEVSGGESDDTQIFSLAGNNAVRAPLLVDPKNFEFAPTAASPALGAASPEFAYPYDARGVARPARPAIGALQQACSVRLRASSRGQRC